MVSRTENTASRHIAAKPAEGKPANERVSIRVRYTTAMQEQIAALAATVKGIPRPKGSPWGGQRRVVDYALEDFARTVDWNGGQQQFRPLPVQTRSKTFYIDPATAEKIRAIAQRFDLPFSTIAYNAFLLLIERKGTIFASSPVGGDSSETSGSSANAA